MPVNSIDAPAALDPRQRPNTGSLKSRRPTVPAPGVAPPADAPKQPAAADVAPRQPPAAAMNLKFSRDEKTGKNVVAVIDPVDGRVLRQMPSDEALKVAEAIGRFQGMFVNRKV
jgi:flagellar protein FlaG